MYLIEKINIKINIFEWIFILSRYFSKSNIYCFLFIKIWFCNDSRLLFLMMKIEKQELVGYLYWIWNETVTIEIEITEFKRIEFERINWDNKS
jgi:hypothetical protein